MIYDTGKGEFKDFVVDEGMFEPESVNKFESILCQGNGYMCVRGALEEDYRLTSRGWRIAGTFDSTGDDCPEITSGADAVKIEISLNGERLDMTKGKLERYKRTLNLKNGLLTRSFTWTAENGAKADFLFERVVSLADFHIMASRACVTPAQNTKISVISGLQGDNSWNDWHTVSVENSVSDGKISVATKTAQSNILFYQTTIHNVFVDEKLVSVMPNCEVCGPRTVFAKESFEVSKGQSFELLKISNIFTSRDFALEGCSLETLKNISSAHMEKYNGKSFVQIFESSKKCWQERIWNIRDIQIDSINERDQLAYRFAIYHLTVMSPTHDNRTNIGAKGMSGPGYRGHAFWDTEIYMLPYFIFAAPNEARSLLEYRFNCLSAAKKNAESRGFKGAMFPWESAWITDGETTPTCCRTGLLEHHITADVAYGVFHYFTVSNDIDFMNNCGYELIFETANFWASRVEFNEAKKKYEILQVIGPDEYKEDVDNNAYTNYMAYLNLTLAIKYAKELKTDYRRRYDILDEKCGIEANLPDWAEKAENIYLPTMNENGILPQDDTYLSLTDIVEDNASISQDPNARGRVDKIGYGKAQVSKQADIMVLFLFFEDLFTQQIKRDNFYYYEKRCFHDSSLSLSTYSVLAADIGENEQAYQLYKRAAALDLNDGIYNSGDGVHSASLGGIWQDTAMGFGGIRIYGSDLRIQPNLPSEWNSVRLHIYWHGQLLDLKITHTQIIARNVTHTAPVEFLCDGIKHSFDEDITIDYKGLK